MSAPPSLPPLRPPWTPWASRKYRPACRRADVVTPWDHHGADAALCRTRPQIREMGLAAFGAVNVPAAYRGRGHGVPSAEQARCYRQRWVP